MVSPGSDLRTKLVTLPIEDTRLINDLCDEFERAYAADQPPALAPYLQRIGIPGRRPLLKELLHIVFERSVSVPRETVIAELLAANPDLRPEIESILKSTASTTDQTLRRGPGPDLAIRCPECAGLLEIAADADLERVLCVHCGCHFSLTNVGADDDALEQISQLAQFRLLRRVGLGSFGTVWRAHDTELDCIVALKIARWISGGDQERSRFLEEARAAAQLKHPHIVAVREVGRQGQLLYIVSDFVDGVTLETWLGEHRLSGREAARLVLALATALEHAHQRGIVHRDLKPSNIMIDAAGAPHILDFGVAKRAAAGVTMTLDGHILGTPAYMSPEQAQGRSAAADARSDVYSVGVILFQLLTGELPFRGTFEQTLEQVVNEPPPAPRKLNAKIHLDLETIVLRCLEKEPAERFATADELRGELQRYLAGEPIHSRPVSHLEWGYRWCRRHPEITALSAALIGVVLVAFALITNALLQRIAAQKRWLDGQVEAVLNASEASLPYLLPSLQELPTYSTERLRLAYARRELTRSQRIRLGLALLGQDAAASEDLQLAVPHATAGELRFIGDGLLRFGIAPQRVTKELHRLDGAAPTSEEARDARASQTANCIMLLARLGQPESLLLRLRTSGDNSVRSYLIDRWAASGGSRQLLVDALATRQQPPDVTRSLLLTLGSFVGNGSTAADLENLHTLKLSAQFQQAQDPGVHAAVRWLLCRWGQEAEVRSAELELAKHPQPGAEWYVTTGGHTMSVLRPATFAMGSPPAEAGRDATNEVLHSCEIPRRFSIAQQETTVEQFQRFRRLVPIPGPDTLEPQCPARLITWSDAAEYCNWLSGQSGLVPEQFCYLPDPLHGGRYFPARNYLERSGFRLPTEAEWEYACRAGTTTPRFFGYSTALLPNYARCLLRDPTGKKGPVATLLPNDFGLFDSYGNATEWCNDCRDAYSSDAASDHGGPPWAPNKPDRVLRGLAAGDVVIPRSALRDAAPYDRSTPAIGFRVARTEVSSESP